MKTCQTSWRKKHPSRRGKEGTTSCHKNMGLANLGIENKYKM